MAAEVRIWLLGGFRVEVDSRPVADDAWRRNKAKAVVKLLTLAPSHRLHREQLMDVLWPELPPDAAAANLRKAVHFARQALAPEHLLLRQEVLELAAERLWIDVQAFEAAAQAGDLAAAIDLYAGELLPEDRFEPWAEQHREQLGARFSRLLLERAAELEAAGDLRGAAGALERLAAVDPLNEPAATGLMRVYALAGQRHLAMGRYRRLEERLAEELGVEPGAPARRLHQEIAAGRFPAAAEPAGPAPAAPAPPATPTVEERKLVTVVLVDATAAPAGGDPERARLELERWAALVCEVLRSWGGTAERLVGGSAVAVFGIPRVHEDDPARGLRAGLEILERSPLPVRVGVATGEVIAPAGHGTGPREIAGEALDAASRLREAAQPGTVLAAERTCRAAGGRFRYGQPVRLPGLEAGARRVAGKLDDPAAAAPRLRGPMIGRDAELGLVRNLFDEVVESGLPRLLTVHGPAGIGKSRMTREVVAALLARHPGTLVLRGRCPSAGRGVTYSALGEMLREFCSISLDDPAAAAQARLRDGLRAILGAGAPAGRAELDATVFALAVTAGIGLPGSPLDRAEPKAVADELARAWPRFATACAAAGPALFVVEDLHWADDRLLEMLELLVARSTGPLLVVATARPELAETRPGFGAGVEGAASISLGPLPQRHSRRLLDSLTPPGRLPDELRVEVLARAEGNPLFLEELVLHLEGEAAGALPDTLQSLLAARIDTLSVAEKRVLQQAAVVGRVFWEEPVERALGGPGGSGGPRGGPPVGRASVAAELHELERRGFLVRRPATTLSGQAELAFRHALIHDVAYASIPRARRARAHAEVGAWLEERAGERRDEFAEPLAHHFGRAAAGEGAELAWPEPADRERVRAAAFAHLLRAGVVARRVAVAKAVELHEQARTLAGGDRERLLALEELGDDHESAYHGEQAVAWWLQALEIARAGSAAPSGDRARLCRKVAWLMASTPGAFRVNPEPAAVEQFVTEGLAAATDEASRAWMLVARGMTAQLWRGSEPFGQGRRPDPVPVAERVADIERALAVGRAAGLPDLLEAADSALGILHGIAGRYDEVLARARGRLDRLAQAKSRLERADILRKAAVSTITIAGGFQEGMELARRCHELSAGTNPHQLMHATWPLLAALYHLGRWHELAPIVDEHVAAFRQDPAVECQFVRDGPVIGATVLVHMGEVERAHTLAAVVGDPMAEPETASAWQARYAVAAGDPELGRRISVDKFREGRLYGPQHAFALLEALLALGDLAAVAEFLPSARANLAGNALLAPACDRGEGLLHANAGRRREAARALRAAVDGFERLGVPYEAARTREQLARVVPTAEARSLLEAAGATYQRLGAAPGHRAIRDRLLALT